MERHAEKLHIIRYEDLIQQPEKEREAFGMWLGLDPSGFQRKMIPDASGRQKKRLSKAELATVMEIAGPTMARLYLDMLFGRAHFDIRFGHLGGNR